MFMFGVPPDVVAWISLVAGLLLALAPLPVLRARGHRWHVAALGALATGLSYGYLQYYLKGGPRVIDATAYLLEARSFATSGFSFDVPSPTASFRGRFLISTAHDDHALAAIFPPGYPALLALGVRLGQPLWVGPVLAAGLVLATYGLTKALTGRTRAALTAAALSALCACLRYHTAETMSHGWAALLATLALWATLRLRVLLGQLGADGSFASTHSQSAAKPQAATRRHLIPSLTMARVALVVRHALAHRPAQWSVCLGMCLGLLLATRQLTGLLFALVMCTTLWRCSRRHGLSIGANVRFTLFVAGAMLPGILLLLAHHHAITGSIFESPQSRYYALADGPGHCFGWGLGRGCAYEHADVVAEQGGAGLTLRWALLNTVHRLHWHALDVANFEPLLLVALLWAFAKRGKADYAPLLLCLVVLPLGYAFFYFNGSYPGAGARFFSELLPIWHALLGAALSALRMERVALGMSLMGFALHGVFSHRLLASPHFGPGLDRLAALPPAAELPTAHAEPPPSATRTPVSQATTALGFVSSAHAFNLASLGSTFLLVARRTHDGREAWLGRLTEERAFVFEPGTGWSALTVPKLDTPLRLEAEFDYPPLAAENVWVHPSALALHCVSRGRALQVHREETPQHSGAAGPPPGAAQPDNSVSRRLTLEVPAFARRFELHWVRAAKECRMSPLVRTTGGERLVLDLLHWPELTHIDHLDAY